jgi:hypothetical protein
MNYNYSSPRTNGQDKANFKKIETEKNLDQIIRQNMRGETSFSPLKFYPKYYDDQLSRMKLVGNKNIYRDKSPNMQPYNVNNDYFDSVQHKYLNSNLWNVNDQNISNVSNVSNPKYNNIEKVNTNQQQSYQPETYQSKRFPTNER